MEARKGAANESGVSKKSIAHRDFAAICCYLQVLGLGARLRASGRHSPDAPAGLRTAGWPGPPDPESLMAALIDAHLGVGRPGTPVVHGLDGLNGKRGRFVAADYGCLLAERWG